MRGLELWLSLSDHGQDASPPGPLCHLPLNERLSRLVSSRTHHPTVLADTLWERVRDEGQEDPS